MAKQSNPKSSEQRRAGYGISLFDSVNQKIKLLNERVHEEVIKRSDIQPLDEVRSPRKQMAKRMVECGTSASGKSPPDCLMREGCGFYPLTKAIALTRAIAYYT